MSKQKPICVHIMFSLCSELVVFMYWAGKSMDNLLSYCGLVDVRINASDKDLPVTMTVKTIWRKKYISYSTLIGIFFQLTWGPFKNLGEDGLVLAKYTKILTMHVFLLLKLYKAITPWLSSFLIWDNFDLFDRSICFEFTFELWLACVEINSWYE